MAEFELKVGHVVSTGDGMVGFVGMAVKLRWHVGSKG